MKLHITIVVSCSVRDVWMNLDITRIVSLSVHDYNWNLEIIKELSHSVLKLERGTRFQGNKKLKEDLKVILCVNSVMGCYECVAQSIT